MIYIFGYKHLVEDKKYLNMLGTLPILPLINVLTYLSYDDICQMKLTNKWIHLICQPNHQVCEGITYHQQLKILCIRDQKKEYIIPPTIKPRIVIYHNSQIFDHHTFAKHATTCKYLNMEPKNFPDKLKHVNIQRFGLERIKKLPANIETLTCWNHTWCYIYFQFKNVTRLILENYYTKYHLDLFKDVHMLEITEKMVNLKYCRINAQNNLTTARGPKKLETLIIKGGTKIQNTKRLPVSLKHLEIGGWNNLCTANYLPPNLEYLKLGGRNLINLRTPHHLPPLKYLEVNGLNQISDIDYLPKTLEEIYIRGQNTIREIDCGRFKNLRVLLINGHNTIERLENIPDTLEYLEIRGYNKLEKLSDLSNTKLKKIIIDGLNILTELPKLPETLIVLKIGGKNTIQNFECLPRLEELELYGNNQFSDLESLPDTCKIIRIKHEHQHILEINKLPKKLVQLEISTIHDVFEDNWRVGIIFKCPVPRISRN